MKHKIFLLLVILFSFSSCYMDSQQKASPSAPNQSAEGDVEAKSDIDHIIPSLPEIYELEKDEQPDRLFQHIDLEYDAQSPDEAFANALSDVYLHNFENIMDTDNFYQINEYTLYYLNESSTGESKVSIIHPDGQIDTLITLTCPIYEMDITGPSKITLQIADFVHYEGFEGYYYVYDIKEKTLERLSDSKVGSGYATEHILYHNQHYKITNSIRATELGEAFDIYIYNSNENEFELLREYVPRFYFQNDRLYCLSENKMSLISCNLYGENETVVYEFRQPIWNFEINTHILKFNYRDDQDEYFQYFADLSTQLLLPIENPENYYFKKIICTADGFYSIDDGGILSFINMQGKEKVIMYGLDEVNVDSIENDYIYFRTRTNNNIFTTWRIKLDGSNLISL